MVSAFSLPRSFLIGPATVLLCLAVQACGVTSPQSPGSPQPPAPSPTAEAAGTRTAAPPLLHPDFPIVSGKIPLTDQWTLALPERFNRRVENGSLVLWRPGLTVWVNCWHGNTGETAQGLLNQALSDRSPDSYDLRQGASEGFLWAAYRHDEVRDGAKVFSLNVIATSGSAQTVMSVYFDADSDIESARAIQEGLGRRNSE